MSEFSPHESHAVRTFAQLGPTPTQAKCTKCGVVTTKEMIEWPCGGPSLELPAKDDVNHPSHYTAYKGLEIIDLTEQMNFNRGNAVKYIARAGLKDPDQEVKDLEKAAWYINREIERIKADG